MSTIYKKLGLKNNEKTQQTIKEYSTYKKAKETIDRYNIATGRTKSYKVINSSTSVDKFKVENAGTTTEVY